MNYSSYKYLIFLCFIIIVTSLSYCDDDKDRLEYNFARDNLDRIEEQALKTYEIIIDGKGLFANIAILDVGRHYFGKGDFTKSLSYLNRIYRGIDDEDTSAEANLIRGKIFKSYNFSGRDLNEAYASFFYIIDVYVDNKLVKNAMFELADLYAKEKEYKKAIKNYYDIIYKYPESELIPDALKNLAVCFLKLGDADSAILWFKKLIDEFPESDSSVIAKRYVTQIFRIGQNVKFKKNIYRIDENFKPDFENINARTLISLGKSDENSIVVLDSSNLYTIDTERLTISKKPSDGISSFFNFMNEKYFTLKDTGIISGDIDIPLSVLTSKGDSYKGLKNIIGGDIDSKGNFYIIDSNVSGVHLFSKEYKYLKTYDTSLKNYISSLAIDPLDRLYLLSQSRLKLLIIDEEGNEIDSIDLKVRCEISKPVKVRIDWVGNVFILDEKEKCIFILNNESELVYRFYLSEKDNILVKKPLDFCIDEFSHLYILDSKDNTIVKFR